MVKRDDLVSFLNQYFEPFEGLAKGREMLINGLQIRGDTGVTKIGLGVSASLAFFRKARESGCNFLIVHHGLGFSGVERTSEFAPHTQERLRFLFQNNLSLSGYHFMLDHHPEIGNNAWVIRKLGAEVVDNIFDKWGWFGRFPQPKALDDVLEQCASIYGHPAHVVGRVPSEVSVLAIVSGSGSVDYKRPDVIDEFLKNKIELEIVGDMKESHPAFVQEIGLCLAAFGHYNTETIGVRNLGEVIKKEFSRLEV